MPRVRESFQHCVFYLFATNPRTGERTGPGATGAFIAKPSTDLPGEDHYYAVTNRHVIENGWTDIRVNTLIGKTRVIETDDVLWKLSNSCDLAILDVTHLLDLKSDIVRMICTSDFLNEFR